MLLEIMVALTIISIILIGAIEAFQVSRRCQRNSQDLDLGVLFAKRVVAQARISGYPDEGLERGSFEEPFGRFGFQTRIFSPEIKNLRGLEVTIFKDERPLLTTTTYLARR